jgi:STE24 endopeptidase
MAAALGAAGFSAYTASRLLAPREPLSAPEPVEPSDYFSAEEIATGRSYARPQAALSLTRSAVELVAVAAAVAHGSSRLPDPGPTAKLSLTRPADRRPVAEAVQAAGAGVALTVSTTLLTLPLSAVSRQRSIRAGLATDSWSGWGVDLIKSGAIEATLTGGLLAGSSALASRTGRCWWAYASAGIICFGVAAVTLGPVVMDPVFNRFDPLPHGETRSDVLALANAAGVDVGEVYSVDASRRTTAANAYVNGLGPTKRVVLFDTLLADSGRDEVRFVVAHELGHVHHRDVPRQLVFMALCAPSMTFAIQQAADPRLGGPAHRGESRARACARLLGRRRPDGPGRRRPVTRRRAANRSIRADAVGRAGGSDLLLPAHRRTEPGRCDRCRLRPAPVRDPSADHRTDRRRPDLPASYCAPPPNSGRFLMFSRASHLE